MNINQEAHEVDNSDLNAAATMYDRDVVGLMNRNYYGITLLVIRNTLFTAGFNNELYGTTITGEITHICMLGYEFSEPWEDDDGTMPNKVNDIINDDFAYEEAYGFKLIDREKKNPLVKIFVGISGNKVHVSFIRTNNSKLYSMSASRAFARRLIAIADKHNRKTVEIDGVSIQFV